MKFKKLDVWKESARLCVEVYKNLGTLRDYGFRDQITRSALSIPSNIAEGEELGKFGALCFLERFASGNASLLGRRWWRLLGTGFALLGRGSLRLRYDLTW